MYVNAACIINSADRTTASDSRPGYGGERRGFGSSNTGGFDRGSNYGGGFAGISAQHKSGRSDVNEL